MKKIVLAAVLFLTSCAHGVSVRFIDGEPKPGEPNVCGYMPDGVFACVSMAHFLSVVQADRAKAPRPPTSDL